MIRFEFHFNQLIDNLDQSIGSLINKLVQVTNQLVKFSSFKLDDWTCDHQELHILSFLTSPSHCSKI